jgi:hypothetical protein
MILLHSQPFQFHLPRLLRRPCRFFGQPHFSLHPDLCQHNLLLCVVLLRLHRHHPLMGLLLGLDGRSEPIFRIHRLLDRCWRGGCSRGGGSGLGLCFLGGGNTLDAGVGSSSRCRLPIFGWERVEASGISSSLSESSSGRPGSESWSGRSAVSSNTLEFSSSQVGKRSVRSKAVSLLPKPTGWRLGRSAISERTLKNHSDSSLITSARCQYICRHADSSTHPTWLSD